MEELEIYPERDTHDALHSGPLELPDHEGGRRQRRPNHATEPADVAPGELGRSAPRAAHLLGPRRDHPRKVAVIEPDGRHVELPGGMVHQPRREPGAPDLDQVRPLMRHDAAGRAGRQHEAVGLLGRDGGTVEPEAANSARLENGIACPGHDDRLAESGAALYIARLLQEVGPHSTGGLTEELGDVQHAELGRGAEPGRQLDPGDVQGDPGRRGSDQLEIEEASRGALSQSSPRAGTPCRSCCRGSCSPRGGCAPRIRSDCRSEARAGRHRPVATVSRGEPVR